MVPCGEVFATTRAKASWASREGLRRLQAAVADTFSCRPRLPNPLLPSFPETFELLLLSGADPPPSANSTPAEEVDNEVAGQARASFSDPLIIAKLHPTDVLEILTIAKRKEIQDAWREGKRLDESDVRRLRVEECKAVASTRLSKDSASEAWGKMYEDGRRWWRELW